MTKEAWIIRKERYGRTGSKNPEKTKNLHSIKIKAAHNRGDKFAHGKEWKCSEEHNKKVSRAMKKSYKDGTRRIPQADDQVIHHINGNHNDDRPENRVALTRREHARIHANQGDYFHWGNSI